MKDAGMLSKITHRCLPQFNKTMVAYIRLFVAAALHELLNVLKRSSVMLLRVYCAATFPPLGK